MSETNKENGLQVIEPNKLISEKELKFANDVNEILMYTEQIVHQTNPVIKGLMQANAMELINQALTPEMMKPVEKLFGSSIGIKTDKEYSAEAKKRIFIEATLGGWGIVGNHINVIGGNMYITKQGYLPRLRKIPDLKFGYPFKHKLPIQNPATGLWSVSSDVEYTYLGKSYTEVLTFPVSKQEGQSMDALLGKADTKVARWLWNKITGQDTIDDSGDYNEADISNAEKGTGEQVVNSSIKQNPIKEDKGELISEMISDEFQLKFNNYIGKSKDMQDLLQRANTWCLSEKAKELNVKYKIEGMVFTSESIDLKVFNELALKFINS